jgi:hypothetical protein
MVADLLSHWRTCSNPVAKLYAALNNIPCWYQVKANDLLLDWLISNFEYILNIIVYYRVFTTTTGVCGKSQGQVRSGVSPWHC